MALASLNIYDIEIYPPFHGGQKSTDVTSVITIPPSLEYTIYSRGWRSKIIFTMYKHERNILSCTLFLRTSINVYYSCRLGMGNMCVWCEEGYDHPLINTYYTLGQIIVSLRNSNM